MNANAEPIVSEAVLNALVVGILLTVFAWWVADGLALLARAAWRFHLAGVDRVRRYDLRTSTARHPAGAGR